MEHRQIIELWPSSVAFAEDLGVSPNVVGVWKNRNYIPQIYWRGIVLAAMTRELDVSLVKLREGSRDHAGASKPDPSSARRARSGAANRGENQNGN
jgi:hypothetical protein